ncbi:zf-HC2 domain-containing protein [bacterium]|nr:zf-HC2 domain-containing protein [bacterium]
MNCRQAQRLYDERLDRRLPANQETALADHLAACADCRAEWQSYQAAWDALGRHQALEPSVGFAERTLRRLAEPERVRAWTGSWRPVWGRAFLAAGLAVVAIVGWIGHRHVQDAQAAQLYSVVEPAESLNDLAVVASLHLLEDNNPR